MCIPPLRGYPLSIGSAGLTQSHDALTRVHHWGGGLEEEGPLWGWPHGDKATILEPSDIHLP